MKHALRILVLLGMLFAFSVANGQTYFFDNYNVRDGLAQSNVYDLLQDHKGYVWMGTASGVSRFDGNSIMNFSKDNGLAENGVRTLCTDNNNAIWLGHIGGGLSRIDTDGNFQNIRLPENELGSDISDIVLIDRNQLWIATHTAGLYVAKNIYADSLSNLEFEHYRGEDGLSDRVFSIYQNAEKQIFLITDVGVKTYDRKNNSFDFFRLKGIPSFFSITCMTQDHKGDFWFGTYNGGLFQYDHLKHEFVLFDRSQIGYNWISTLFEDSQNRLWVGTWGGGISLFENGEITNFNKTNGLQDNKIRCISEDREGNILIGTNENGITIFKGRQLVTFMEQDSLLNNHVWAIQTDAFGNFWFGTNIGISIYDSQNNEHTYVTKNSKLTSDQVRFIKKDQDNNMWVGMWNGGGVIYSSPESNSFSYPYNINRYLAQISRGNVSAMEIDKNNNLWIGTFDGLLYFEINNGGLAHLTQTSGLAGNDITALYADSDNNLWVGSRSKGITRITDTIFSHFMTEASITPTSFIKQKNGKLWVGTESKGVFVLDENMKQLQHYTASSGILSNYISALEKDGFDNVFIATNKGVNKYIAKTGNFQVYTQKSGIVGVEVKHNSIFRDDQGRIWFGTVQGVTRLDPTYERSTTSEPLTHIERFKVNFKARKMEKNLELPHNQNSIILGFNSIYLTDPKALEYKFILKGADPEWRFSDEAMDVTYTSLRPGDYTFKVLAKNSRGQWNEQASTYSFKIKPPFWQTWWFTLVVVIILFAAVYAYIRLRERKLRREKAILEERVKQRTKKIREQNIDLESKNKAIFDSINYARRIQTAIMHDQSQLKKIHTNSTILYKPKDIVSGDFYWFSKKGNKIIVIAADCTGHGVPGAFMSLIGISTLNKIVNENNVLKPSEILDAMRTYIITELQQTGKTEDSKDGMDIALAVVDKQNNQIEFAGAYNSLYIVRKEKVDQPLAENQKVFKDYLLEVKGDRMPIGISEKKDMPFSNNQLELKAGDELFLTTDGYIDQFGGKKGKKLMARRFKEYLLEASALPLDNQARFLDKRLIKWRGENEQIDDVLLIATKW